MQGYPLFEKLAQNLKRIPERNVHAKGRGASKQYEEKQRTIGEKHGHED